jgi:hypothetical protein
MGCVLLRTIFLPIVKGIVIRAVQARSVKGTVVQAFFIIFLTAWNFITEFASVNIWVEKKICLLDVEQSTCSFEPEIRGLNRQGLIWLQTSLQYNIPVNSHFYMAPGTVLISDPMALYTLFTLRPTSTLK